MEKRGIRIPDVIRLFFIPTKQSYAKHTERIKCGRRWDFKEEA
jgi:hypothetical protein